MKRLSASLAVGLVALPALLSATERDAHALELGTPASDHPYRSAQNFALELRFSPYKPQIDDDPALTSKPFANTFGDKPRLGIAAELDWQVLRLPHFGTLGPGFGVGYVHMSRPVKTTSGRDSGDETSLTIYPLWAVAVVRADVLWHDFGFPLVPYVKGGIGVAPWRASNSAGTSSAQDVSGKGTSWGTNFALGIGFALDALDPGASRNMDNATGINSTYVFFEYYALSLNGIGQSHALQVGSSTWAMGLAFEF
jgi:hypothetical protein